MIKYILKRLGLGLLTLFILIVITFTLTKVMPGSPLQSKNISGDVLAKMEAQYGLDKPVVTQLFIYIKNMLQGDLGTSYKKTGTSVTSIIKQSMIPTMKLGLVTTVLVLVVGIFAGIMMAKSKSPVAKGAGLRDLRLELVFQTFL